MSLLDQARELEGQVIERLTELEPLIAEYNQLRQLAERLGVSYTPPGEGTGATAPAPRGTAKKSARGRSAAKPRAAKRTSSKRAAKRTSPTRPRPARPRPDPRGRRRRPQRRRRRRVRPRRKPTARRRRARKAAGTRPGQRSEDVLRVVGEQPGISVREISERLGVDATGLYRVTNKLTADGRLRKDGTKLYLVETMPGRPARHRRRVRPAGRRERRRSAQLAPCGGRLQQALPRCQRRPTAQSGHPAERFAATPAHLDRSFARAARRTVADRRHVRQRAEDRLLSDRGLGASALREAPAHPFAVGGRRLAEPPSERPREVRGSP